MGIHHSKKSREVLQPIQDSRHLHQLDDVELMELSNEFDEAADDGALTCESFCQVMDDLQRRSVANPENTLISRRLFQIFDVNDDGKVDKDEFLKGMALLCKGSMEDKIRLTFQEFVSEGCAHITRADMFRVLKEAYLHALDIAEASNKDVDLQDLNTKRQTAAVMVRDMVDDIFVELDQNGNQKIEFSEFREWALHQPTITATVDTFSHGQRVDGNHEVKVTLLS